MLILVQTIMMIILCFSNGFQDNSEILPPRHKIHVLTQETAKYFRIFFYFCAPRPSCESSFAHCMKLVFFEDPLINGTFFYQLQRPFRLLRCLSIRTSISSAARRLSSAMQIFLCSLTVKTTISKGEIIMI